MILKLIVIVTAFYELFKILNLKTHNRAFDDKTKFSKIKTEEGRQVFLKNMKNPILTLLIIITEITYLMVVAILLFTPLVWIATLMLLLSIIIGFADKMTDKQYSSLLKVVDSIITIVLMVYAFHHVL